MLKHLEGLSGLRKLSLGDRVTDAGLVHLRGMKQLRKLDLTNSRVTDDGKKALQAALSDCEIVR